MNESSKNGAIGTTQTASPAEVRGAIDHGQSGDKVAGFDPAASPMETDSEAGGAPSPAGGEAPMQTGKPLPRPNAATHGTAMRPFDDAAHPKVQKSVLIYVAVIVVAAAALFGGLALWA
jgi:hypothetical protein